MSMENGYRVEEVIVFGCFGLLYDYLKKYDNLIVVYEKLFGILEEIVG